MDPASRWAENIVNRVLTGRLADSYDTLSAVIAILRQIQQEAAAAALSDIPPLEELLVDDERASQIRYRCNQASPASWRREGSQVLHGRDVIVSSLRSPNENHNLSFIAASRLDVPDLLRDRDTLLRLLFDSEGYDAYRRGYEEGKEAGRKEYLYGTRRVNEEE